MVGIEVRYDWSGSGNCAVLTMEAPDGSITGYRISGLIQLAIFVNADLLPEGMFKPEFHVQCRYEDIPIRDGLPHYKGNPARFHGSGAYALVVHTVQPNPKIERTSPGEPGDATHLKRWAAIG